MASLLALPTWSAIVTKESELRGVCHDSSRAIPSIGNPGATSAPQKLLSYFQSPLREPVPARFDIDEWDAMQVLAGLRLPEPISPLMMHVPPHGERHVGGLCLDEFIYEPMAQWPTEHALEIQHLHWYVARGRAFIGKRLRELFAAGEQLSTEELDDICRWMENTAPPSTREHSSLPRGPPYCSAKAPYDRTGDPVSCFRRHAIIIFRTERFANAALRPVARMKWPEDWPPLQDGQPPPPETVVWVPNASRMRMHAVNASRIKSVGPFSDGKCYLTFFRFFMCMGDCGCDHTPYNPVDLAWMAETGAGAYIKAYLASYVPTEIHADLPVDKYEAAKKQLADPNIFPKHRLRAPQRAVSFTPEHIPSFAVADGKQHQLTVEEVTTARWYYETYRVRHRLEGKMYSYTTQDWNSLLTMW